MPAPPPERRADYRYLLPLQTRWMDNDAYGHVNNVEYYSYFDTVINHYLIQEGGLDIIGGAEIGVCAESLCRFHAEIGFPEALELGLRVTRLGNSSVRYEVGIFRQGNEAPAATGYFVHVFISRTTRKPLPVPERIRKALAKLVTA